MSEIGAGSGTSYPTSLDTNNNQEVNAPAAGKTRARAEVINDLAAAIVAIETELGTAPKGTAADVKTFLQVQHNLDGTHKSVSTDTLSATGQITSTLATGTAPLVIASTTKVANLNADLLDGLTTDSANTVSTVVARDSSGNFAAGTITAALTGNASGSSGSCTGNAATATTATNASGTGTALYSDVNGLKIIRGSVAANGTITSGTGFTVSGPSSSEYTITPSTLFSAKPTGLASINLSSTDPGFINCYEPSATGVTRIYTFNSAGSLTDKPFHFIIIGPK